MMQRVNLEPAYVLHRRPYSNTSLLLDVFTATYGRMSALARSARGLSSRYRGKLELFYPMLISWSGRSELKTLGTVEFSNTPIILDGRLGYMLFYQFSTFIHNPMTLFQIWQGGMSFHGGLLGVAIASLIYSRLQNRNWFDVLDFLAPLVPVGLAAGRIGNFINGELWGRETTVPWGMVFPNGGPMPRHPSQLYEFFLEGVLLFIILWIYSAKSRPRFAVAALFLFFYGLFRFCVEFFREPDVPIGFIAEGWLTEGQLLSFPMILIGLISFIYVYYRRRESHV